MAWKSVKWKWCHCLSHHLLASIFCKVGTKSLQTISVQREEAMTLFPVPTARLMGCLRTLTMLPVAPLRLRGCLRALCSSWAP